MFLDPVAELRLDPHIERRVNWLDMLSSVKKMICGQRQQSDSAPRPRPQRRPPLTPPLQLRTMQLVAKQPENKIVLRDGRKVNGHGSVVRESWPSTRLTTFDPEPKPRGALTPPSRGPPIIKFWPRTNNELQRHRTQTAEILARSVHSTAHPHWSVPGRAPPSGRGSEASMMSLLLFCHR